MYIESKLYNSIITFADQIVPSSLEKIMEIETLCINFDINKDDEVEQMKKYFDEYPATFTYNLRSAISIRPNKVLSYVKFIKTLPKMQKSFILDFSAPHLFNYFFKKEDPTFVVFNGPLYESSAYTKNISMYAKRQLMSEEMFLAIYNDDVDYFIDYSSKNVNFSFKDIYTIKFFDGYPNYSLLNLSAYFGSIKTFKYFILNNSPYEQSSVAATTGGNLEIIRILLQKNVKYTQGDAYNALMHGFFDIADFIGLSYGYFISHITSSKFIPIKVVATINSHKSACDMIKLIVALLYDGLKEQAIEIIPNSINLTSIWTKTEDVDIMNAIFKAITSPKLLFEASIQSYHISHLIFLFSQPTFDVKFLNYNSIMDLKSLSQELSDAIDQAYKREPASLLYTKEIIHLYKTKHSIPKNIDPAILFDVVMNLIHENQVDIIKKLSENASFYKSFNADQCIELLNNSIIPKRDIFGQLTSFDLSDEQITEICYFIPRSKTSVSKTFLYYLLEKKASFLQHVNPISLLVFFGLEFNNLKTNPEFISFLKSIGIPDNLLNFEKYNKANNENLFSEIIATDYFFHKLKLKQVFKYFYHFPFLKYFKRIIPYIPKTWLRYIYKLYAIPQDSDYTANSISFRADINDEANQATFFNAFTAWRNSFNTNIRPPLDLPHSSKYTKATHDMVMNICEFYELRNHGNDIIDYINEDPDNGPYFVDGNITFTRPNTNQNKTENQEKTPNPQPNDVSNRSSPIDPNIQVNDNAQNSDYDDDSIDEIYDDDDDFDSYTDDDYEDEDDLYLEPNTYLSKPLELWLNSTPIVYFTDFFLLIFSQPEFRSLLPLCFLKDKVAQKVYQSIDLTQEEINQFGDLFDTFPTMVILSNQNNVKKLPLHILLRKIPSTQIFPYIINVSQFTSKQCSIFDDAILKSDSLLRKQLIFLDPYIASSANVNALLILLKTAIHLIQTQKNYNPYVDLELTRQKINALNSNQKIEENNKTSQQTKSNQNPSTQPNKDESTENSPTQESNQPNQNESAQSTQQENEKQRFETLKQKTLEKQLLILLEKLCSIKKLKETEQKAILSYVPFSFHDAWSIILQYSSNFSYASQIQITSTLGIDCITQDPSKTFPSFIAACKQPILNLSKEILSKLPLKYKNQGFITATKISNLNTMQKLYDAGADINFFDSISGLTPLKISLMLQTKDAFNFLIERNVKIGFAYDKHILFYAISNPNVGEEKLKILLQKVNIEEAEYFDNIIKALSTSKYTHLIPFAKELGCKDYVSIPDERSILRDKLSKFDSQNAFIQESTTDFNNLPKYQLLNYILKKSPPTRQAIDIAFTKHDLNFVESMKILMHLNKGVSNPSLNHINLVDPKLLPYEASIAYAIITKDKKMFDSIYESKPFVVTDYMFYYAIFLNSSAEIVERLIEIGYDVNRPEHIPQLISTAHKCIQNNNLTLFKVLVSHNLDVNRIKKVLVKDNKSQYLTLLNEAILSKRQPFVDYILTLKVRTDLITIKSPFETAISVGSTPKSLLLAIDVEKEKASCSIQAEKELIKLTPYITRMKNSKTTFGGSNVFRTTTFTNLSKK